MAVESIVDRAIRVPVAFVIFQQFRWVDT